MNIKEELRLLDIIKDTYIHLQKDIGGIQSFIAVAIENCELKIKALSAERPDHDRGF